MLIAAGGKHKWVQMQISFLGAAGRGDPHLMLPISLLSRRLAPLLTVGRKVVMQGDRRERMKYVPERMREEGLLGKYEMSGLLKVKDHEFL